MLGTFFKQQIIFQWDFRSSRFSIFSIDADALKSTCSETGGVFIESSKSDVDDIVALLSQSIQTSQATLAFITEREKESVTDIHIDNSITEDCYRIGIKLTGSFSLAQLATPDGSLVVDLLNTDSLVSSGLDFEVVYQGPGLLNMNFKPNVEGTWQLQVNPTSSQYSTDISAACTFNFLAKMYRLDWNSTHPSLAQIQGQPISSETLWHL